MFKKYITAALLGVLLAGCASTEKATETKKVEYEAGLGIFRPVPSA